MPIGSSVHLLLRVANECRAAIGSVHVLVSERRGEWRSHMLYPCEAGYSGSLLFYDEPHVVFYAFELGMNDGSTLRYVPCADGSSTVGELVADGVDGDWSVDGWVYDKKFVPARPEGTFGLPEALPGFQVTVFDGSFETPSWLSGAVMYQIFPDRFARGAQGVRKAGLRYHERMGRPVLLHDSWDDPVEWHGELVEEADGPAHAEAGSGDAAERCAAGAGLSSEGAAACEADADEDGPARAVDADSGKGDPSEAWAPYDPIDFFGGTLAGITENLPYLASLGVEVLYLNPVFEARSNHRYDTADYERIDPLLGDKAAFEMLCRKAKAHGISVVLDAVLSHTGNDSRYFNALGTYGEPGAWQGWQSPYRSWYDFDHPSGDAPYRCWWGHPTLPEVDECDESWQRYVLGTGNEDGILSKWIGAGARGYRLDVADEIPDGVLERVRWSIKSANPQAAIIGEVWEDATTKESYGRYREYALGRSLDSVMNYPLRDALLGFATGAVDARQLTTFLRLQQANYPQPLYGCLMNLLSSHDVERVRSVLALGGPFKQLARSEQIEAVEGIRPEDDVRAAALQRMVVSLLYALPGAPCIYYGDEAGLQGGGDPFCRATFPWRREGRADCGTDLTEHYREIGAIRQASEVMRHGRLECHAPTEDVLCITRMPASGLDGAIVAVANRSASPCKFVLDLSDPHMMSQPLPRLEANAGPFVRTLHGEGHAESVAGLLRIEAAPCSTTYFELKD